MTKKTGGSKERMRDYDALVVLLSSMWINSAKTDEDISERKRHIAGLLNQLGFPADLGAVALSVKSQSYYNLVHDIKKGK